MDLYIVKWQIWAFRVSRQGVLRLTDNGSNPSNGTDNVWPDLCR